MASIDAPKYIDLMNWIREQILSGEFTVGMRLPSENELGKKFSISRQFAKQQVYSKVKAYLNAVAAVVHMYQLQKI